MGAQFIATAGNYSGKWNILILILYHYFSLLTKGAIFSIIEKPTSRRKSACTHGGTHSTSVPPLSLKCMTYTQTSIPGVLILEPQVFKDERGYFFESFRESEIVEKIGVHFVQENQSWSNYGVLRGMHFQKEPYAQAKLARVLSGAVHDVVIDIRKNSPTFGKHIAVELSAENKKQLFIPVGCSHGFLVMSREGAEFFYKCSAYYNKESESGIRFDDPALDIDWRLPRKEIIVAEKDLAWKTLAEL